MKPTLLPGQDVATTVTSVEPPATLRAPGRAALCALSASIVFLGACGGGGKQRSAPPAVPVTVAKVVQKTMPVTLRAIGHVEAIATVAVKARIGGELQKVWFTEGQAVAKGATLFTIDPRQYDAALRLAEAQLARDRALLDKAEADTKRYEGLVKQDFVTKEQFDQIIATAASLRAGVAADQASVDNARLQLAYCTITSPVEGRTGNLNVRVGNLVKADDTGPLVTINQVRPIFAGFSVPAQYLQAVLSKAAGSIRVSAVASGSSAPAAEGTLTFVDNNVDPATSTVLLKATFPNQDESLWPGQFVDVTVILGEEANRIVAPSVAVLTGQQGQFVYVVKDDDTVDVRPVKVVRMDEADAVVAQGLSAGETVVTDGQLRLVAGAKIAVKTGGTPETKQP